MQCTPMLITFLDFQEVQHHVGSVQSWERQQHYQFEETKVGLHHDNKWPCNRFLCFQPPIEEDAVYCFAVSLLICLSVGKNGFRSLS